jgi:hypothetical protein
MSLTAALEALQSCRTNLLAARADAVAAVTMLYGTRLSQAAELTDQLDTALAHCEKLIVETERDMRAEAVE